MRLADTNLTPAPTFHRDPVGNVFFYNGDVYRGIRAPYAAHFKSLLEADFFPNVVDNGLVETSMTDLHVDGYDLVVKHKKIEFESVWGEWCSLMIKDAALLSLRLNLELARHGYICNDIKPGNVLFDYTEPTWIDFSSIMPLESVNPTLWIRRFWRTMFLPLLLMSKGQHAAGRAIYQEVPNRGLQRPLAKPGLRQLPHYYFGLIRKPTSSTMPAILERLLQRTEMLTVAPPPSGWMYYPRAGMPAHDDLESYRPKQRLVYDILRASPPGSVLDLGCNKGWYAELAAGLGHSVVATDIADETICDLYQRIRPKRSRILPLLLDFAWPTPEYGLGLEGRNAFERLNCDVTLALALVHHLVFASGLRFELIASILSRYTRRVTIVEFPPREDEVVSKWLRPGFEWYTLENFIEAMRKYFPDIAIYAADRPPRKLLVCRKRVE